MFKKILFTLVIISPLLFLFVGYPILQKIEPQTVQFPFSQRCFVVGNTQDFFSCFHNHERIAGVSLISQILNELHDVQPGMGYVTGGTLILLILCVPFLL